MTTNSWSKRLTIPLPDNIWLTPLGFMKDGQMLLRKYNCNYGLVAYNSTTRKLEQVNVSGIERGSFINKVVTYLETLSFPNS
ncbi:hypothetical protein P3S68_008419 [Capsicum galapagoense]